MHNKKIISIFARYKEAVLRSGAEWRAIMHRSIAGYNPYKLFILTIDYSKKFTTTELLTIEHMVIIVVKSIYIPINVSKELGMTSYAR